MDSQRDIRRFIISRFLVTLAVVGVVECLILVFVNNVMLPFMTFTFFPQLEGFRVISVGTLIIISFVLIICLIARALYNVSPVFYYFTAPILQRVFVYYGIGTEEAEMITGMDSPGIFFLLMTSLAAMILIVLPFVVGGIVFSLQVTKLFAGIEQKNEEERRANEKRRYLMISDIAHDLKTPMTTVSGYARALSDGVVPPERQKEYLDAISLKAERMNDIVLMLFDYVRLDSEGFELMKRDTDVCELMRGCVAALYHEAEEAGDEIEVDIPEEQIMLNIDRIQFSRVINNLIVNAVKHNERGTKILVRVASEVDEVRIFVADSGKLIDREIAGDIFDPFVMGDKSRSSGGGSGLGLAVASHIIELHGFKIKLVQAPESARYRLGDGITKAFVIIAKV